MRSVGDARASWQLLEQARSLADLRTAVGLEGAPSALVSGQRSACWKAFLLFESMNRAEWPSILADSRNVYNSLRTHFLRAVENPDELESALDPLSENEESPWVVLRKDEDLRAEIFQDIDRCMPDNTYFRQPDTQNMMLDILFIFCKLNPDLGYRQGMHEVLAPILWVVERDAIDTKGAGQGQTTDLVLNLYDSSFVEHDTFTLYGLVMQNGKSFYEPSKTSQSSDSPMLVKCRHIFEKLLPRVDPALAAHLSDIEVAPQMFLMRWMRLLFGREFPFDDLLPMWDLIFAADPSLEVMDFTCVAMLSAHTMASPRIRCEHGNYHLASIPTTSVQASTPNVCPRCSLLEAKPTWETGSHLIQKYSGRAPAPPDQQRPTTPQDQPSSPIRQRSPFGSMHSRTSSGGIEAIIQDAARGVYKRGERWGVNKAVRDAVGDFRRNMQGIQSGRATPPTFRAFITGETSSAFESATILQKVAALEAHNKSLSKMLQGAVAELWDCQKEMIEGKGSEKATVEALSMAIAKVQVMQVYLEDPTIPLPVDEPDSKKAASSQSLGDTPKLSAKEENDKSSISPAEDTVSAASDKSPVAGDDRKTRSSSSDRTATATTTNTNTQLSSSAPPPTLLNKAGTPRTRPSLASSSFSWMLGQEPDTTAASSFAAASTCSSIQPLEKRERRRNKPASSNVKRTEAGSSDGSSGGTADRAFLFGDTDDEFMGSLGAGGGGGGGGGGRFGGKKGRAKDGSGQAQREIYDLGEVGSGNGNGSGTG